MAGGSKLVVEVSVRMAINEFLVKMCPCCILLRMVMSLVSLSSDWTRNWIWQLNRSRVWWWQWSSCYIVIVSSSVIAVIIIVVIGGRVGGWESWVLCICCLQW